MKQIKRFHCFLRQVVSLKNEMPRGDLQKLTNSRKAEKKNAGFSRVFREAVFGKG
jgi:hypothetical protein